MPVPSSVGQVFALWQRPALQHDNKSNATGITAPIPLADVIDGLMLHRVVCYFLKARFQPIKILFGLRHPEVFQPVQGDVEQVPSASGASS